MLQYYYVTIEHQQYSETIFLCNKDVWQNEYVQITPNHK